MRPLYCVALVAVLLAQSEYTHAESVVYSDNTQYSIPIQYASAPCWGTCDLSPAYNQINIGYAFSITKITFNWNNPGGNNCDGVGHYNATISGSSNTAGLIAVSSNSIYVGCGGSSGSGELDFVGQAVPSSFHLDFASIDGGLQGGAAVNVSNVEIWGNSLGAGSANIGLPIIFVHGFCDGPDSFLNLEEAAKAYLQQQVPNLYPDLTQTSPPLLNGYVAFYNGTNVQFQPQGPISESYSTTTKVDPRTRFFFVAFNDDNASHNLYQTFDPNIVATVPIATKGKELAHIIWRIKAITGAPRVILVTHSMGGVDARSYIENLAEATAFNNDVAALVTLDAVHGGSSLATIPVLPDNGWSSCFLSDSPDKYEMQPDSPVMQALNYISGDATPLPSALTITSIASYWTEGALPAPPFLGVGSDDVVTSGQQDLGTNVSNKQELQASTLIAKSNTFNRLDEILPLSCALPLHLLTCVGSVQQTYDLVNDAVLPATAMQPGPFQIIPATLTVPPGAAGVFFQSTAGDSTVWSILEGGDGGDVSQGGAATSYNAPNVDGASIHVVAINGANPTQFAVATVNTSAAISQVGQIITFDKIPTPMMFGDPPITMSATSTSGMQVQFRVVSGPGSVNSNILSITGPGSVIVAAYQAGNALYAPAEADQTIEVDNPPSGLLFNQTDYSATSRYALYSSNWYQLGTGFSGVVHTLDFVCYFNPGWAPAQAPGGSVYLSEFADSNYSQMTNSYPIAGANGNPSCPLQATQMHLTNLNIPVHASRYYRLDTGGSNYAYSDVFVLGTTSQGYAFDLGWTYGIGLIYDYYTFYPYILSNTNNSLITWPTPAPITSGTPLSAAQLNAATSVPGAFVYSPGLGTVLPSGVQTLSVTFTPADIAQMPTIFTVTLAVDPAPSPLSSITISPASPTIHTGGSQQFTATGTYKDASTQDLTNAVVWSSSNTGAATMSSSGLATALTTDFTNVTASLNGVISNTAVLTVLPGAYTAPSTSVGTSSGLQTATVSFTNSFTVGSIAVVTQGAENLDFQYASGGSCAVGTTYGVGETCTVNYTFTPIAPGGRMGAILFKDDKGEIAATTYIRGLGTGPQVVFSVTPTAQIGSGFGQAYSIAVDANGNVFVADPPDGRVLMVPPNDQACKTSCVSVGGDLLKPTGVAIDGAGNLYIVDEGNNRVLKAPSTDLTCSIPSDCTAVGAGISDPLRIALDGLGNVYIVDAGNNRILKVPPTDLTCSIPGDCTTVGAGLKYPQAVAVDGLGNVFIAPDGNGHVVKVPPTDPTCTNPSDCTTVGQTATSQPQDIAVDAAGDIYTAAFGVWKVLSSDPDCSNYNDCPYLAGAPDFSSVAVDGAGSLYVGSGSSVNGNSYITKLISADPPSMSFGETNVGSTNRFRSTIVSNVGNSPLVFSTPTSGSNPSYPLDFPNEPSDANLCASGAIAPGGSCDILIDFTPTTAGLLNESVVLTNNAPNSPQSINVSGTALSVLSVSPSILPNGNFGLAYTASLSGVGGASGPYSFMVIAGLPPNGLTLSSSGVLSGTPSAAGTFSFTIRVTDSASSTGTQAFTLIINQGTPTLSVTNSPVGYDGNPHAATVTGSVSGIVSNVLYNGSPTVPISAGTYAVTASFTPTDTADFTGLSGISVGNFIINRAQPTLTWTTPAPITYGTALSNSQLDAASTLSGTFAYAPSAGAVLGAGIQNLSVTFTPSDSTDYTIATQSVQLTVNQANQTIAFPPPPSPVTYGIPPIPLSATASSGLPVTFAIQSGPAMVSGNMVTITGAGTIVVAASQPGNTNFQAASPVFNSITVNKASQTIVFAPPTPLPYQVGPVTLSATGGGSGNPVVFIIVSGPATISGTSLSLTGVGTVKIAANETGNANYLAATQVMQSIAVTKATPVISWPTPASITYGTALSSTQLDAATTISGNFAYAPPAGRVLAAGLQSLSVTFTPSNTADYAKATTTVQLTVRQAIPTITWATPAPITYGKALSGTQLNAKAPVGGTYVYSPPAGTVLNSGVQTLDVSFTPNNSTDYTPANSTVQLIVNQAPQTIIFSKPASPVNHTSPPITLSATASSGLLVTFSVQSGPAAVSGNVLSFTGATGTIVVAANQSGNSNYLSANQVTRSINVK